MSRMFRLGSAKSKRRVATVETISSARGVIGNTSDASMNAIRRRLRPGVNRGAGLPDHVSGFQRVTRTRPGAGDRVSKFHRDN
jgi:hypothetical protein